MNFLFERLRNLLPGGGDRPEHYYFRLALSILLLAIVLTVVLGLTSFLISLRGPEKTMVPNVERQTLEDATIALQEKDLYPRVQLRHFSDPSLKGKVVEQDPAAGTQVREGKRIQLLVSKGAVVDRVGEYVGRSLEEVRTELQTLFSTFEAVLKIDAVSYVYDEADPGTILEQEPQPGTEITGVTNLDLVVSRGPDVERVELRSYAGLSYEEAVSLLEQKNIPFVFKLIEGSPDQNSGVVLSQSPEAGSEVPVGSKVTLEMIPPRSVGEENVFGLFKRTLPDYPVAVELTLELVSPTGERETVFSMEHPGGDIAVPYLADENDQLVLSRFETQVITETVSSAVPREESGDAGASAGGSGAGDTSAGDTGSTGEAQSDDDAGSPNESDSEGETGQDEGAQGGSDGSGSADGSQGSGNGSDSGLNDNLD
jgi:beta-lactam-binding protein with PASTA domain